MPRTDPLSAAHAAVAIRKTMQVRREEYVDHMTFRANRRPLFTEIFGPLVGLKEEWAAQGATPEERHRSRLTMIGGIDKHVPRRSKEGVVAELEYKTLPEVGTALLGAFAAGDQGGGVHAAS